MKSKEELFEYFNSFKDVDSFPSILMHILTDEELDYVMELYDMYIERIIELTHEYEESDENRIAVTELKKDVGEDFANECRSRYLEQEISNLKIELSAIEDTLIKLLEQQEGYMTRYAFKCLNGYDNKKQLLKKYTTEYYIRKNKCEKSGLLSEQMIVAAREYPITSILKFDFRGFAKCPYHSEKTASMSYWKKNNLAHCFGCGVTKDSIQLVMDIYKKSFPDAVKHLNSFK